MLMDEDALRKGMMKLSIQAGTMPKPFREQVRKVKTQEERDAREKELRHLFEELILPHLDAKKPMSLKQLQKLAPWDPETISFRSLVRMSVNRGWCRKSEQTVRESDNYLVGYVL